MNKAEIVREALAHAKKVNNFLDCDVIQDARTDLLRAKNDADALEALQYIASSINYRQEDAKSRKLAKDYAETFVTA